MLEQYGQDSKDYMIFNRDDKSDFDYLLPKKDPVIVIGGLSHGKSIVNYLNQYENPLIYGFEANPDLWTGLKRAFANNKNVNLHFKAVGSENKPVVFNIFEHGPSSSVLSSTNTGKEHHGKKYETKRKVEVDQVRIDCILPDIEIDFMKLDLQGYETEALKGCENILDKIKMITLEISFVSMYDGQALFGDIDVFLRERNFGLFNFSSLWYTGCGQITAGDSLYLNKKYFKDIVKC